MVDNADNTITDPKKIVDMLQDQFKNVFSNPMQPQQLINNFGTDTLNIKFPLPEPARVLIGCKETLCTPLQLFYQNSFNSGIIPTE